MKTNTRLANVNVTCGSAKDQSGQAAETRRLGAFPGHRQDETVSLDATASFWGQVDLWPSPNWPTVITAFGIAFLACSASVAVSDMIQARRTGVPPWDHIRRDTAGCRFWTYAIECTTVSVGCGIVGAGIALLPLLPIIAAGVAPLAALKGLSGGTLEDEKRTGDDPDAQAR